MSGILKQLANELTPEWTQHKGKQMSHPDEDTDKPPMPAPGWKPEVEKTPLDPKDRDDEFDKDRDDTGDLPSDPRQGFTPKP